MGEEAVNAVSFCRPLAMLAAGLLLLSGLYAQQETIPVPARQPAQPNSFAEVSKQLDAGGEFYVYMSTADLMPVIRTGIDGLRQTIAKAAEENNAPAGEIESIMNVIDLIEKLVVEFGTGEIDAVGGSSVSLGDGNFRNRFVLYHQPGQDDGILWKLYGADKPLKSFDYLPQDAVLASSGHADLKVLWGWIRKRIAEWPNEQERQQFEVGLTQLKEQGFDLDKIVASLGSEVALVLTLDRTQKMLVPTPDGTQIEAPNPAAVLMIEVQDSTIFDAVSQKLAQSELPVVPAEEEGVKMQIMNLMLPVPFLFRPTVAQADGFLYVGVSDLAIRNLRDVKAGKRPHLRENPVYQTYAKGLPKDYDGFTFTDPLLLDTYYDVLGKYTAAQQPGGGAATQGFLETYSKLIKPVAYVGVVEVGETGVVQTWNANQSYRVSVAAVTAVPVMIAAGVMLPALARARQKARQVNSLGNVKQLCLALLMYSGDHDGKFPEQPLTDGLSQVIQEGYIAPGTVFVTPGSRQTPAAANVKQLTWQSCSYVYVGNGLQDDMNNPTLVPLIIERPLRGRNSVAVGYADGHVETQNGRFRNIEAIAQRLVRKNGFPADQKQALLEKARAADKAIAAAEQQ